MFNKQVGLAPIANYSDYPFRKICEIFGAKFIFTEMISADALTRNCKKTWNMIPKKDEKNTGIQIFGNDVEILTKASIMVEKYAKWIDINAGCPVNKIVRKGSGSALLNNLDLLANIIVSVKKNVNIPVGVKVRLGFNSINISHIYKSVENAGADYIIVHGRTREEFYKGKSNKCIFSQIVNNSKIPVGASGDVYNQIDIDEYFDKYNVNFVLAARGAIGNPWIFNNSIPNLKEIKEICLSHLKYQIEHYQTEHYAVKNFRKILINYFKGINGVKDLRRNLNEINTFNDVKNSINKCLF